MDNQECKDDWHLSYEKLARDAANKRGGHRGFPPAPWDYEEADKRYDPARTCPTCGEKKIYGD